MKTQPISSGSEWTFELIQRYDHEIGLLADEYRLDTYPRQIEIISAEQMMDAYSSIGMPIGYHHWSYGKQLLQVEQNYRRGQMGLAYEIVINSNPCIAYLMEENSMMMQALVIAHAAYGHNSFFKNNYLFRAWTNADAIVDYLIFARNYIRQCEERQGETAVEQLLDSCHALMNFGVDRYHHPPELSLLQEQARQEERETYLQSQVNELWRTIPVAATANEHRRRRNFPEEPQENILYFVEKNAPLLQPWQREIVRIVRKIAQYFYPQRQTQVMNEGWATFWHYTLINTLYDRGLVDDGFMMGFIHSHSNVIYQPPFNSPYYSGINPYTLGFSMMSDIRRICEAPTDEDRDWFPDIAGSDWLSTLDQAMRSFRDESFILQFLSPTLIRKLRLFNIFDDDRKQRLEVTAIHDEHGYREIRKSLSNQYNIGRNEPNIEINHVEIEGDRSLTLRHTLSQRRPLHGNTTEVLRHLARLWGFTVRLETVDSRNHVIKSQECPIKASPE